jgi:hypothetical protein
MVLAFACGGQRGRIRRMGGGGEKREKSNEAVVGWLAAEVLTGYQGYSTNNSI